MANFKNINNVPELDKLSETDKLIVNSSGAAKQISIGNVNLGGGGGMYVIYPPEGTDFSGTISLESVCNEDGDELDMTTVAEMFRTGAVYMDISKIMAQPEGYKLEQCRVPFLFETIVLNNDDNSLETVYGIAMGMVEVIVCLGNPDTLMV